MPETLEAVQSIADLQGGGAFQSHQIDIVDRDPDDLAQRARAWFLQAIEHPLWRDYIKYAKEDLGYYVGGDGQWSRDGSLADLDRLKAANRTTLSINHIQPVIDILLGFEKQNRFDIKASPQGAEDPEAAQILSWVMKFVQDQTECPEIQSEMFEEGLIEGASAVEVGINWLEDPVRGKIEFIVRRPGMDVIWDPYWKRYDCSDARYMIVFEWRYLADILAAWPEQADRIRAAADSLMSAFGAGDRQTTDGLQADSYGSVGEHKIESLINEQMFFDPLDRRMLVCEVYYRDYERRHLCVNRETQEVIEPESRADANLLIDSDPERWRYVERLKKVIRQGTVIPAAWLTLEDGPSNYENDDEHYPIVPYVAKRKGNHLYGVVRNLKDPQLYENKRVSQVMDMLGRFGSIRHTAEQGSLENERALEEPGSTSTVYFKRGKQAPGFLVPPVAELAKVLTDLGIQGKMNIREVSGVNTDLLGIKSDTTSGIAIARRQAQGQTISTGYFDNLRRTRKIIGQRLARRIQQCFTTDEYIRLTNPETGAPSVIHLNPAGVKHLNGDQYEQWLAREAEKLGGERPAVLKDITALKYDVVISESPNTPSARATALLAILEVAGKIPAIMPAVIDTIIELAEIPDRDKILQKIRAILGDPGVPQGEMPAAGVPGVGGGGGAMPVGPVRVGGPANAPAAPGGAPGVLPTVAKPDPPGKFMPTMARGALAGAMGGGAALPVGG